MGQQSSTQIDEVEDPFQQLKMDIIEFVEHYGWILDVSRAGWTKKQKDEDREKRRDELVNRFAKFTERDEKLSLMLELKKINKNPANIINKLDEKIVPLKF